MSTTPKFASNKKCWQILNKLAFEDTMACPNCQHSLQENYKNKYLWLSSATKNIRRLATVAVGSTGPPATVCTNLLLADQALYGNDLLASRSQLYNGARYIQFRKQLPGSSKLTAMLEGVVQVDESYFGKRRSKQPQHIVVGAKDTTTGRIALRITDSRDRQPLEQFVQDYIVAGSLVAIDKWWAYDELELLGYAHS